MGDVSKEFWVEVKLGKGVLWCVYLFSDNLCFVYEMAFIDPVVTRTTTTTTATTSV
jgi:hypothetical protein